MDRRRVRNRSFGDCLRKYEVGDNNEVSIFYNVYSFGLRRLSEDNLEKYRFWYAKCPLGR